MKARALACQRPTQLLRADWPAFDFEQETLLLRDSKGRGGARDHLLPLSALALEQLKPLRELNAPKKPGQKGPDSPFVAEGSRPMVLETLSKAVREISDALKKEKGIPRFQLRDLRRYRVGWGSRIERKCWRADRLAGLTRPADNPDVTQRTGSRPDP